MLKMLLIGAVAVPAIAAGSVAATGVVVVDALFSGQGGELNIRAGFAELQKRRGDIVRVDDNGKSVRIWIDESK